MRECNVVDFFVMTGISEFWSQSGRVDPVNVWLRCSAEEMGVISSECHWSDCAHDLVLFCQLHSLYRDSSEFALSRSNDQVTIGQDSNDIDTQTEEFLDGTNSLVDGFINIDFEDITCLCTYVAVGVIVINSHTGEMSFHITEIYCQRQNFLINLINRKNLNTVLKDSDKFAWIFVEKYNLMYDLLIRCAIKTLAWLYVPDN